MSKNRKNRGLDSLKDMNIGDVTSGANLKETPTIDPQKNRRISKVVYLPEKIYNILTKAKKDSKIVSLSPYIIDATREKMERDGLI